MVVEEDPVEKDQQEDGQTAEQDRLREGEIVFHRGFSTPATRGLHGKLEWPASIVPRRTALTAPQRSTARSRARRTVSGLSQISGVAARKAGLACRLVRLFLLDDLLGRHERRTSVGNLAV